nr:uncharacterized protein LOC102584641 [Ipomoea batatas]
MKYFSKSESQDKDHMPSGAQAYSLTKMGMVVVISLPFILFSILLGFGCYFLGRARGRQDLRTNAQVFGVPAPPPGSAAPPSVSAAHAVKPDATVNVV